MARQARLARKALTAMSTNPSVPTKRSIIAASAAAIVGSGLVPDSAKAQLVGTKRRAPVGRSHISIPGREVIQVVVELAPGVTAPAHTHPGEKIIYVIEGSWEVTTHPSCADHAAAVPAAGVARASRMAVRALRPLRRPVSTMEQRAP